jgi:hypothetical protein
MKSPPCILTSSAHQVTPLAQVSWRLAAAAPCERRGGESGRTSGPLERLSDERGVEGVERARGGGWRLEGLSEPAGGWRLEGVRRAAAGEPLLCGPPASRSSAAA